MVSLKSVLLAWDGKFPKAFAGFAVGELQFVYALFQLLRNNTLFLLLIFCVPTWLMRLFNVGRLNHVVLMSDKRQYSTGMEGLGGCLQYLHKVGLRNVKQRSKHWYSATFAGHHYLCHQNSLMALADLCMRRSTQRLLFADSVVKVTDKIRVAKLISTTDAVDKLLTGDYQLYDADEHTVFYCFDWLKVDSKWIPVLSAFPIYLQAIGANSLSGALSCFIIVADAGKNAIWSVYDTLFTKMTDFTKLKIMKKRAWLYDFLGMFSDRWKYCDPNKKHAYILKSGSYICIGKVCRMKGVAEDEIQVVKADEEAELGPNVEYKEGEVAQWSHRDEDFYFDILDGRARFHPRTWGNFYLYVRLRCDIFVA